MEIRAVNEEVAFAGGDVASFGRDDVMEVAARAMRNPSGKYRICLHRALDDGVHEMLVGLRRDVRYPPHRHPRDEESYLLLHGAVTYHLLNDDGTVSSSIRLAAGGGEWGMYARIPAGICHLLEIESDVCVFLETRPGPYSPDGTEVIPLAKDLS